MIVLLALPICFIFADEECDHQYSDDGDCTTPVVCTVCNDVIVLEAEHNYNKTISYSFEERESTIEDSVLKDNIAASGTRRVKCSNEGCTSETVQDIQPLVSALGYSIKENTYAITDVDGSVEQVTVATIISTYFFNTSIIDDYAKHYNLDITYGTILYLQDLLTENICGSCEYKYNGKMPVIKTENGKQYTVLVDAEWKDVPSTYICPNCGASKSEFYDDIEPPISSTGRLHQSVIMPSDSNARITDIAIKNIHENDYNEKIVITSFMIIENEIFYIQSGKVIDNYKDIVPVTCSKILEALAENN